MSVSLKKLVNVRSRFFHFAARTRQRRSVRAEHSGRGGQRPRIAVSLAPLEGLTGYFAWKRGRPGGNDRLPPGLKGIAQAY
jgi:hypothetical protein